MKLQHIASLLVTVVAALATPAFASGYGPAPFHDTRTGAPASQAGPGVQVIVANNADTTDARSGYGGVASGHSESANRLMTASAHDDFFTHH
ncbi:hypothetical protein [Paraburkholderia sacchari]|uniref:hypothetical protein n=1 Tax=Paraburkholderia sacchari TaxID=159450 RepID=UPI0005443B0C|nr:hypothetical protein [Paraburkholderia sacchari]NLP63552.1 hypothetical protein [Paraburkholderia sacchari]